jgi:hypothetical protein
VAGSGHFSSVVFVFGVLGGGCGISSVYFLGAPATYAWAIGVICAEQVVQAWPKASTV